MGIFYVRKSFISFSQPIVLCTCSLICLIILPLVDSLLLIFNIIFSAMMNSLGGLADTCICLVSCVCVCVSNSVPVYMSNNNSE